VFVKLILLLLNSSFCNLEITIALFVENTTLIFYNFLFFIFEIVILKNNFYFYYCSSY